MFPNVSRGSELGGVFGVTGRDNELAELVEGCCPCDEDELGATFWIVFSGFRSWIIGTSVVESAAVMLLSGSTEETVGKAGSFMGCLISWIKG